MKGVDFNLLAVFEAIVRTRSVTIAAEEAGLSKAAMSHALARLRRELGDPVLVRSGKDWQLSERALALRSELSALTNAARRVLSAPTAFEPATADREFRINATDHMLSLIGVPLGHVVAKEAPGVALRFLPIAHDDASPLREGNVDLAFGFFRELPAELRTQSLFDDRLACVVRRGHPRVNGRMTLKCFLAMKHVIVAPRGKPGTAVDDALAARGLKRRAARSVPFYLVALDLVAQSDCVVTMSERLARAQEERFRLQVLRPPL